MRLEGMNLDEGGNTVTDVWAGQKGVDVAVDI